ncbi:hypothetical protein Patl1_36226 [Pistacia atlantica]|nr:hypothetical protein Patl1_36226 [Pistacia atlantica]
MKEMGRNCAYYGSTGNIPAGAGSLAEEDEDDVERFEGGGGGGGVVAEMMDFADADDKNVVFSPCDDAKNLAGGFVVAFAGRKYAARSVPQMISDVDNTGYYFNVLEFHEGTLQNLHWKSFGCDSCGGDAGVCLNNTVCAVPNTKCKKPEASADCKLSIQLTFSGTDESREVLNSWYEVENLRKFSLFDLYANVRDAMPGMPN